MPTLKEHITVLKADDGSTHRVGGAFSLTAEQKQAALDAAGLDSIDSPTTEDAVREAAKALDGYESMTSQDIADALNERVGMKAMSLSELGKAARANGAVQGEFGHAFASEYSSYLGRLETNIQAGDYADATMLVEEMPPGLSSSMSSDTLTAIQSALDAHALRRVDEVAGEMGVTAPDPVEATDVDAALGR